MSKKIILASNSPRRQELLRGLDIEFTVDTGNTFEESMDDGVAPHDIPVLMAQGKSHGFHRPLAPDEILITADTVVIVRCSDIDDATMGLGGTAGQAHEPSCSSQDPIHFPSQELSDKSDAPMPKNGYLPLMMPRVAQVPESAGCTAKVLGKPHDREEAIRMLKDLSGKVHEVITAVTIRDCEREVNFSDSTLVRFCDLSEADIEYYVDKYRPFDKAGAYGIQEWIGYAAITGIEGSFYNVMGFPVHRVYTELKKFL